MSKKIAVIGFGAIGRHHARNLAAIESAVFAGVVDPRPEAQQEARELGYDVYSSLEEAIDRGLDAVVLSVPTSLHASLGRACIEAGLAVLIEKPIASTVEEGAALIGLAEQKSVPLMIGYVERYNPAVVAVRRFIADGHLGKLFSVSARRVGVMPARIQDANVLIDIGVHDIDLVAFITNSDLTLKSALGGRALLQDRIDYASLALDANGVSVDITSNWITPVKIRELFITGEHGLCHIDYITQAARFASAREFDATSYEGFVDSYVKGAFVDLAVQKEEPLRRELLTFVSGLDGGQLPDPRISLTSLRIAQEATELLETNAKMQVTA